jgi:6-phosphogluconolactonase
MAGRGTSSAAARHTDFVAEIDVLATPEGMADAAADRIADLAASAISERGRFTVALSGGSTPEPVYRRLAREPHSGSIDWSRVEVFWGDERCVPPDHEDSNYRLARRALLDEVAIPATAVHRIRGELPPVEAARRYEREIRRVLAEDGRFDLIMLGLGPDGHTASLFPGTSAVLERRRAVVAVRVEKLDAWRVTMTLPLINEARHVVFLVSGSRKAEAVRRVLADEELPAARVDPRQGRLTWLLDADAAEDLPRDVLDDRT